MNAMICMQPCPLFLLPFLLSVLFLYVLRLGSSRDWFCRGTNFLSVSPYKLVLLAF